MMKRFQRPKPAETDEDLIRQNEQFMKELQVQSNPRDKTGEESVAEVEGVDKKKPTIQEILQEYNISSEPEKSVSQGVDGNQLVPDPVYEELHVTSGSTGSVKKEDYFPSLAVKERGSDPCPVAVAPGACQPKKKVSKFARSRANTEVINATTLETKASTVREGGSSSKKELIGGTIHPLLEGMTEAEILEEQRKLIQKMDPKLVDFVRSMKHKKPSTSSNARSIPCPPPVKHAKHEETTEIPIEELPINPDEVKMMPHMDKIESNKLLWTLPPKPKSAPIKPESKPAERNARFNFEGKLFTEAEEKDSTTWLKGLHNHGDEMQRPGYRLDELLTLARSTNGGQRAGALDTFAEILRNAHDGMFDFMLGKSIFDLCLEMNWIYVVRKGLDHNDTLTINAALNCLSALLYPEREEMCLDTVLIWSRAETGPCIVPEKEDPTDLLDTLQPKPQAQDGEQQNENDDKDEQVLRQDLIEFLLRRSCLLERFEHLLYSKTEWLTTFGIINMFKILIRVGRHSPDHLIKEETILDYFSKHYLKLNTNVLLSESKRIQKMEGIPSLLFLKLLRILISSSKTNADAVMQKYETKIFASIEENLSCSDTLLHVVPQIELLIQQSILAWMSAVSAGYGLDRFFAFTPITMKFFNLYLAKPLLNTFDLNHSALMIALLLKCLQAVPNSASTLALNVRQYSYLIEQLVVKACNVLGARHLEDQVDLDATLIALSQCLQFLSFAKLAINYQSPLISKIEEFMRTTTFETITKRIAKSSLLLCKPLKMESNFDTKYPKNLIFTEAILFGGNLCLLLREGRFAFVFLTSLLKYVKLGLNMKNADVLTNKHVRDYLEKLTEARTYYNEENYYTKFELVYLTELMETLVDSQNDDLHKIGVQLTYKLCSVPRAGNEELSKRFLLLFLNTFSAQMQQEEIADLQNLYSQMVDLQRSSHSTNEFQVWRSEVLSSGWLTEPLKAVHSSLEALHADEQKNSNMEEEEPIGGSDQQATKLKETELSFRIIAWRILRFIRLCTLSTSLESVLTQTKCQFVDFYTKLCQVFLMSPTIFLYQPIRENLQDILKYFYNHKILSTSKKSVVFTKSDKTTNEMIGPVGPASPAFESFYSQLVTEFSNTSYGDEVFSAYVLLPLRVQESKQIKMRFWTDVCVRFVRLQKENGMLPLSYFIGDEDKPAAIETDPEILQLFESLLKKDTCTQERNQFLHDILTFYLQMKTGA